MKSAVTAIASGIVGVVIGAAGWALIGPDHAPQTTAPSRSATASASPAAATSSPGRHYASAQAIADAMSSAGLVVTMIHKSADGSYISEVGGTAYDLQISEHAGQAIGDSGINMFPNREALTAWVGISKRMGGIAVVGDTWAVSLPSSAADRHVTSRMAPRIAKALGGTVER